jgi:putative membrane protein
MNASLVSAMLVARSGDDWGHWWAVAPLFWALWLAVIATVVWLVIRRTRAGNRSGLERAREILAERFARGELSADEYRERLDQLGASR